MTLPSSIDILNFIFVFVLIWWVVIFAVLPWGNAPSERKDMEPGQASSAPARPRLKLKLIVTTLVALLLAIVLFVVLHVTGFRLFGPEQTIG